MQRSRFIFRGVILFWIKRWRGETSTERERVGVGVCGFQTDITSCCFPFSSWNVFVPPATPCASVDAISRAVSLWLDQYIPRANKEYRAYTFLRAVGEGSSGTCCSKLLSLGEKFPGLGRSRGPCQVEVLMLNKQYENSVFSRLPYKLLSNCSE